MVDHVFPEDEGTGASDGDFADAANFASYGYHQILADYIITGLSVTTDGSTFDVSSGMCSISDTSANMVQNSETRDQGVLYSAIADARSGVSLPDTGGMNYIYVEIDLTTDDSVSIIANTTDTAPSNTSLKIAEVDASVPEVTPTNRNISASLKSIFLGTDPGNGIFVNAEVSTTPAQGDEQSYSFNMDGVSILTVFSEADGAGGIQNQEVQVDGDIKTTGELTEGASL